MPCARVLPTHARTRVGSALEGGHLLVQNLHHRQQRRLQRPQLVWHRLRAAHGVARGSGAGGEGREWAVSLAQVQQRTRSQGGSGTGGWASTRGGSGGVAVLNSTRAASTTKQRLCSDHRTPPVSPA